MRNSYAFTVAALIILLLSGLCSFAQTRRIDSLKQELVPSAGPEKKLNTLLVLCEEKSSLNPDTLLQYALAARYIALQHGDSTWITLSNYYIAYNLVSRSLTDSGLAIINQQLSNLSPNESNRKVRTDLLLLKARAYNNTNRTKESLDLLYPMLADAEKREDTLTLLNTINMIIGAYVNLGQDRAALEWGQKAVPLFPAKSTLASARITSVILSNLCLCYLHLYESENKPNWLDSGKKYISPSIVQARRYELIGALAYDLGLSGTILGFEQKLPEGEALLKESLKIYRGIGNVFSMINAMSVMANFYGITKQPQKGIDICKEALALSKSGRPNIYLYGNLAENYKLAGDYRMYGETLYQLMQLKDSLYKVNSAEALSSLQTRYEVQKKENIIIRQKLDLTRKNNLIYGVITLFIFLFIGAFIVFAIRKKNQAMKLQELQMAEKRKSLQAVLHAEDNERKRIAAELHDGVAQKMVAARLNLLTFETLFKGFDTPQQNVFDNISSLVDESCTEVRDLSHSMMPQAFFRSGLTEAVKNLLNKLGDRTLLVNFSAEGSLDGVPEETQLMVYRIIQECVQNVLKHAQASKLDIAIIADSDSLDITVEDNGCGFDALKMSNGSDAEGVGINNIRSRVAFLSGGLDINSRPGDGTLIAIYIPLKQIVVS